MTTENYSQIELTGTFQKANWQELYDLFSELYDPLSLREFRGYVTSAVINDYVRSHWKSSNDKKGFGELMVSCAGKEWRNFKIKFFDSKDAKRFLELDINIEDNKIVLIGSLDNKNKLVDTLEAIKGSFSSFRIMKQKGTSAIKPILKFLKDKWIWIILIIIVLGIFYKQLDWSQILDVKYWLNQKLNLPFKNALSKPDQNISRPLLDVDAQVSDKGKRPPAIQTQSDADFFKQVQVSIAHLTSSDARDFMINAYRNSTHKVTISQLSTIAGHMVGGDICQTIQAIAPHIINDGNLEALDTLLNHMCSSDAQVALNILLKAKEE